MSAACEGIVMFGTIAHFGSPEFQRAVTALYREGSTELAEEAERSGRVAVFPEFVSAFDAMGRSIRASRVAVATDSPLEADMARAFSDLCEWGPYAGRLMVVPKRRLLIRDAIAQAWANRDEGRAEVFVFPQVSVQQFRVDFCIIRPLAPRRQRCLLIECDGREWHTRPDQVQRDKKRDRALQAEGYPVFRFTGSEIFEDAHDCAASVLHVAFGETT